MSILPFEISDTVDDFREMDHWHSEEHDIAELGSVWKFSPFSGETPHINISEAGKSVEAHSFPGMELYWFNSIRSIVEPDPTKPPPAEETDDVTSWLMGPIHKPKKQVTVGFVTFFTGPERSSIVVLNAFGEIVKQVEMDPVRSLLINGTALRTGSTVLTQGASGWELNRTLVWASPLHEENLNLTGLSSVLISVDHVSEMFKGAKELRLWQGTDQQEKASEHILVESEDDAVIFDSDLERVGTIFPW